MMMVLTDDIDAVHDDDDNGSGVVDDPSVDDNDVDDD